MGRHGRPIENPASFQETLRKFMETNAVPGVAKEPASSPSAAPYGDLYSSAWVRAILTNSDIDASGAEPLARKGGDAGRGMLDLLREEKS